MGVFSSRALFLQMFQATWQEDACAHEALSTKDMHEGLCFKVLELEMHLCVVLAETAAHQDRSESLV